MVFLTIFAAVACCGTLLSVLSTERYRRVREIEIANETPPEPPPSIPVAKVNPFPKLTAPKPPASDAKDAKRKK